MFGETRLFASAYLETAGRVGVYLDAENETSLYETGIVTFQEMCGADADSPTCGGEACDGTCVTGAFFGLAYDDQTADPATDSFINFHGLHVREFSTRK